MPYEHMRTLRQRADYLALRAEAKRILGWDYAYDVRERAALVWAIAHLTGQGEPDDGA